MTKKYATKQFTQFLPMIEKACWHYYRKYHLDRADIESQAFLIFCNAIEKLDIKKASFSTYLFNELKRLDRYCKYEFQKENKDVIRIKKMHKNGYGKNVFVDRIEVPDILQYDIFDKVITKMDYEISLSNDAKEIVKYILSREWERIETNWKPSFSYIQKKYLENDWTKNRIVKAWQEIKEWWQGSNKDQFCMEV
jgi:hypothetical protein